MHCVFKFNSRFKLILLLIKNFITTKIVFSKLRSYSCEVCLDADPLTNFQLRLPGFASREIQIIVFGLNF